MLLLAVVLAGAAAALALGPPASVVTGGPQSRPAGRVAWSTRAARAAPSLRLRRAALLGTVASGTWALGSSALTGTQLGVAAVAVGSGAAVARGLAGARRAEEARRRRRAVVDFCEALVGELRAGQPVLVAVERSAVVWLEVAPVVAAARLDTDLPAALRRLSTSPGAEALQHLASAWELCAATGGGLTSAASGVLESARADAAALRQVESEVASARATARLVAGLPIVVLVAGQGLGAHPWAFLFGHPVGVACLASGLALVAGGLAWIDRIARSVAAGEG